MPIPDRDTVVSLLARVTSGVGLSAKRSELRPVIAELLTAVGLDPVDADWLTGPSPRFKAPLLNAAAQRREKLQAVLGDQRNGVLSPLGRFVWLEWRGSGDALPTTMTFAAEEVGVTESSLRVRLSLAGGSLSLQRQHPLTHEDDIVVVSRLAEQPSNKPVALDAAEARLNAIRKARTGKRRGAY
jgi:hypothetical protein